MAQDRTIISCGVYLFNSNNKLLLGHPTGFKPNVWAIPKGRMDSDETDYFDVAKRELVEETGINLEDYTISLLKEFPMVRYRETNKYLKGFFIKIDSDFSDIVIKCYSMVYRNGLPAFQEFDNFKWVSIEESRHMLHEFQFSNLDICSSMINERLDHLKSFKNF